MSTLLRAFVAAGIDEARRPRGARA